MYAYKDIVTGKVRKTRGVFVGWTSPTGLLGVKYAIFRNYGGDVLVPAYCLTPETRAAIAGKPVEVARIHGYTPSTPIVPTAMAALLQAAEAFVKSYDTWGPIEEIGRTKTDALRAAIAQAKGNAS